MDRLDHPLLRQADLAALRNVRLHAARLAEGAYAGSHRSPAHGSAVEFAEHRPYTPGDDLRRLDWKVLGRTGRRYIRRYEVHRNLVVHALVDSSSSMHFGGHVQRTPTKLAFAATVAALVAFVAARDGESITLTTTGAAAWPEPVLSWAALQPALDALDHRCRERGEPLAPALARLSGRLDRRGLVLIISDMLDDLDPVCRELRLLRARGFSACVLQVIHPEEQTLPAVAAAKFVDPERTAPAVRARPAEMVRDYQRRFEHHVAAVRQAVRKHACHWAQTTTDESPAEAVRRLLTERAHPC